MVFDGQFIRFGDLQFTDLNTETEVSITKGNNVFKAIIMPEDIALLIEFLEEAMGED